ncbi:hypothetical protein IWZ03DRAFT_25862 [Phyllosticta citriasiana]|uniref:Cell surface protein n=1 Tax=Phyllosticta citriasiana TaxID=595635 RepID=A0ABR1L1S8_9PEZI
MSNIGSNTGSGLRGGVHSVHGAGEAIRGQINAFADSALGSNDSAAQNQAIADRGVNEFQTGTRTHNPGSSFDKHPSDTYQAPAAGHHPGSSFDKHPSDVRAAGLRGNPAAENWGSANTTSTTGTYGNPSSANAGPHSSNVANTVDPRVDSDLSNRGVSTSTTGTGNPAHVSTGAYGNPSSTNVGPHGSNMLNKADPRIDSDRDNRGLTGNQTGAAAGPHSSNMANKADPRVDSDRDNRGAHPTGSQVGSGSYHTGPSKEGQTTGDPTGVSRPSNAGLPTREDKNGVLRQTGPGGASTSTNAGPHDSNVANKADPRVDSDRDNRSAALHGVTPGSYGSEDLATDAPRNTTTTGRNTTTTTTTTTGTTGNVGTGVTPGSYGAEALETDAPTTTKHQRPDSGHGHDHEDNTGTANVHDDDKNKGSHPPHKSNLLNKIDPRVKTSSS